jgi:16S rRNA processing protein RimM
VQEQAEMADRTDRKVCIAVITGPHGVRGQVRVKSYTEEPDGVMAYGPVTDGTGTRQFRLQPTGVARGQMLARIDGVTDRNAAEALRGVELYVDRDRLPPPDEEEFYHADLIGLMAVDESGNEIGSVRAMQNFGAGDLIEIAITGGRVEVYPFTREVVPVIDLEAGRVVVVPPPEILVRPEDASDGASDDSESEA